MMADIYIIVFIMFDSALGPRLSSAAGVDLVVPKAEGLTGLVRAVNRTLGTSGLIKGKAEADRHPTQEKALE